MRKSYGNTWWGKQWLNALKHIDYSNRLPRGRTYANKGAARDIEIKENHISANVQGSRPRPYKVSLTIPPFSASQKAQIIQLVTANPAFLSKLLNRELPDELHAACLEKGIRIFPNSWSDIDGYCSCPDWAVPCKHLASVLYLVANEIDKNPFLVFELHNFDLFKGLEGVGYTAAGQKDIPVPKLQDLWQAASPGEEEEVWDEAVYNAIDFSNIPAFWEQLAPLLEDNAVFFPKGSFKTILATAYKNIGRATQKNLQQNRERNLPASGLLTENVEIWLDTTGQFLECQFWKNYDELVLEFKSLDDLVEYLENLPLSSLQLLAVPLRGLYLAYRLATHLAEKTAFLPQLLQSSGGQYIIRWVPALLQEDVRKLFEQIDALVPKELLLYKKGEDFFEPIPTDHLQAVLSLFLGHFIHTNHGFDYRQLEDDVVQLFFNGRLGQFDHFENREYPAAIQLWLSRFFIVEKDFVPVLQIEDLESHFKVNVAVEDKTDALKAPIDLREIFETDTYNHIRLDVLRDLAMLSDHFPQISHVVASSGKEELLFDSTAFVDILFKILPTIRLFGIKVLLPKALRKLIQPQLSMMLEGEDDGVVAFSSIISLENMLRFQWQVALGDQLISPEEFRKLVEKLSGIVKLNDQYIHFDEKEIQKLIEQLENPPVMTGPELLQTALTEEYRGAKVKLDAKARKLIDDLLKGEGTEIPQGLEATLRPYQLRGYEWLYKNSRLGFGSLIADDMGLGKTLQVIATLLKLKEDGELGKQKGLIIVPTTLLTNWQKEIQKFAPNLTTHIYHGSNRSLESLEEVDLLITTYGVVRSESSKLNKEKWLAVVIDEAQNIKNPTTAQTKAVKKISAPIRIAMSGTPVENRLSEYWSIFDFSNKGYLGNLSKFKERFAQPIEISRDKYALKRFRKITEPFILRRVKSDKSIIQDLPDKIEKDEYCQLTPEQTALYQSVVDNTMRTIEESEGITRKGLILKLITALKQVCNHPRQFLKKGKSDPALSGKAHFLLELLAQTLESGEKTLIFTQYREMGVLLVDMLKDTFGLEAPFLHGGVSRKQRDQMVEDFQHNHTTRIMLLSLKAGGTGLNLTAASNVIHYDLWWNPAVEAQATDRAYRIGQQNNVMVHRFITQNTFEEKINKLLQNKKDLADLTVSTGEKWIGELSNSDLKRLVKLER